MNLKLKLVAIIGLSLYSLVSVPSTMALFTAQARSDDNRFTTAISFGSDSPTASSSPTSNPTVSPSATPSNVPSPTPLPSGGNVIIVSGNGAGSSNTVNVNQSSNTTIVQQNNSVIINQVSSQANTGHNQTVDSVNTGSANSSVNITVLDSSTSTQINQ